MALYLGIDIGTSGTRALLCTVEGKVVGVGTAPHTSLHPRPGWSEQEPEEWWQATVKAVRSALNAARRAGAMKKYGPVAGIGLSGQMHGSVFLSRTGKVVCRAILWNDQRTAEECAEIESAAGGRRELINLVANPAHTGFTAPKILWLRKHQPKLFERVRKVLLPKDYIRYRMTGEYATEVSDASGTLLLDVVKRRWCSPLLEKLQLDPALLPECYESEDVTGKLTKKAAQELGLPEGVPVVGGGGDQAAGAVGVGIVRQGVISATMGTSGVVFAFAERPNVDPLGRVHTFCHAVRNKWHVMGVVLSAGGSLQWFRNQLAQADMKEAKRRKIDVYEILTNEASEVPVGSEGLFFLPYLTGERTPYADPHAKGAWIGLTVRHTRAHLIRALMEGATFAMRDCLEIIKEMGVPVREIRLSGGGARSAFWRRMQADIYGQNVVTVNAEEGPAYGVALLAMAGTGAYDSVVEACEATIQIVSQTAYSRRDKKLYDQAYPIYRQLYHRLKDLFPTLTELAEVQVR